MNDTEQDNKIIIEQQRAIGCITLNYPSKLNAQSHAMTLQMLHTLQRWQKDSTIKVVIIKSSTDKAFCAGGDIKQLLNNGIDQIESSVLFFKDEYDLNLLIAMYPKPIVCFCQGITMGGGCGLSLHASHSIAADNIKLAMPETKIGLFPDIGATYLFARLPNKIGYYLALTGNTIDQPTVLASGLMSYAMTEQQWQLLEQQLIETPWQEDANKQLTLLLQSFKAHEVQSPLQQYKPWIEKIFSVPTLKDVFQKLRQPVVNKQQQQFYQQLLKHLSERSPHSLLITWQALKHAETMTLAEVLQQDLKLAKACLLSEDFYIGVTACLINKTKPVWSKASILDYDEADINRYFMEY